jgi:hypothetical protein
VNRARGRIGFDYIGVLNHDGSGMRSSNLGMVLRADITRINGTYWNVSGYWRGRFNSTTAGTQTLDDLINRTYHLYTTYDNPNSAWVAGFGRLYLPWATSLDTIDGGYFGRRLKTGVTAGLFLGSTPDPTSYSYAPNREIGGAFVNFEGGSSEPPIPVRREQHLLQARLFDLSIGAIGFSAGIRLQIAGRNHCPPGGNWIRLGPQLPYDAHPAPSAR